jgi:hypothetical protein
LRGGAIPADTSNFISAAKPAYTAEQVRASGRTRGRWGSPEYRNRFGKPQNMFAAMNANAGQMNARCS